MCPCYSVGYWVITACTYYKGKGLIKGWSLSVLGSNYLHVTKLIIYKDVIVIGYS